MMKEPELERDLDINRDALLKVDSRGRITVPSNIRFLNDIDPKDDMDYYVDYYLDSIIYSDPEAEDEKKNEAEKNFSKRMDNRARITIPLDTRDRCGMNLDDDGVYFAEVTIERIEVQNPNTDGGES